MNLSEQERQHLIDLNKAMAEAEFNRKTDFFSALLADDLQFRRADGTVAAKKDYLDALADTTNTYDYNHAEDIELITSGDTVLVALRVWAKGIRHRGQPNEARFQGIFRNIRLFRIAACSPPDWECYLWFNEKLL